MAQFHQHFDPCHSPSPTLPPTTASPQVLYSQQPSLMRRHTYPTPVLHRPLSPVQQTPASVDWLHLAQSTPIHSQQQQQQQPPLQSQQSQQSQLSSSPTATTSPVTPTHPVDRQLLFASTLDDAISPPSPTLLSAPSPNLRPQDDFYNFLHLTTPPSPKFPPQLLHLQQHKQWLHHQQLQQLLHNHQHHPTPKLEQLIADTSIPSFPLSDLPHSSLPADHLHQQQLQHTQQIHQHHPYFQSVSASAVSSPYLTSEPRPTSPLSNPLLPLIDKSGDLTKPINALGPLCFAGFYLVSLTRTIVRNRTVPKSVRRAFIIPQLHFGFTVRDKRDQKWRNIPTVQIPYDALSNVGDWIRIQLNVTDHNFTFKQIKDALQKAVTDAWADANWKLLVDALRTHSTTVSQHDVDDVLECESISGRAKGTPHQFFKQINCHKGAADIRLDVDGAISARESLKSVLSHLGLNSTGCNISIAKFREEVFPLWKHQCAYVREHDNPSCCQFYDGGYFKKIMIHKHLYNVNGCTSSYHVKDLFEGLDEVIKVWNNPTGMCVREAKCAAGLRYNVDKSFQSGIRSYSKAKFLEAAPHTARDFLQAALQMHSQVQKLLKIKQRKHFKCRKALHEIEMISDSLSQRQLPEILQPGFLKMSNSPCAGIVKKRKRLDRDMTVSPSTPREQKRKHAHLSLKRKEAAEQRMRQYLEVLRDDCQKQQKFLESVESHGDDCDCVETQPNDMSGPGRYPTSANVPVA